MKLFLIISDTHGDLLKAKEVLSHYPQIDALIHLGDYCRDALTLQSQFHFPECIMVSGNCDYSLDIPNERVYEAEGKSLFITHGNLYDVKSGIMRLESKASKERYDIVLFGHTHVPLLKNTASALFLNPGSLGYPRGLSGPTYALLEISKGRAEARILDV
jgi:putative phosphoesterase